MILVRMLTVFMFPKIQECTETDEKRGEWSDVFNVE